MPNWFVYDANGTKHGPISSAQLKALANSGKINREMIVENENGQKAKAGQLKGLIPDNQSPATNFSNTSPSENNVFCTSCGNPVASQAVACMKCGADPRTHRNFCRNCGVQLNPDQVVCVKCGSQVAVSTQNPAANENSVATDVFCTSCGSPVSPQAVACMKCGAEPTSHKNFCRSCGAKLNLNQVVCVKCGSAVGAVPKRGSSGPRFTSSGPKSGNVEKNRVIVAVLAFIFGYIGVHWFYLGNTKWAVIHLLCFVVGVILVIPAIFSFAKAIYDGITFLRMSDEEFQDVYCSGKEFPKFFGI